MAASYVAPVQATEKRLDQGIDYQGQPGGHVVAIGYARVNYVKPDPGGFGEAIYYTLLDGPMRGRQIYVGHARPDVKPGDIVQPGDPVATLLQHGLGNASNLPGWTEIGFAKNGRPDPGTAKEFERFVKSLPADAPQQAPQPQPDSSGAGQASQPVTLDTSGYFDTTQPAPELSQPYQAAPGSGMLTAPVADMWSRIAAQPGASPDTVALAQNAALTGG